MTSRDDFDVVRRVHDAWNDGDIDRVLTLLDPEIVWQPGPDDPFAGRHVGVEGLERFLRSWARSFDRLQVEPGEPERMGDWLVAAMRQRGRPRGSAIEIDTELAHAWRIANGKITGWRSFRDVHEARAVLRSEGP